MLKAALLSLLAFLGLVRGFDLASLPAPANAQQGAAVAQQHALHALVADVSGGKATITGERLFTVDKSVPWAAIAKRIDNLARERGAAAVALPGADPGKKLAQAWRAKDGSGVMVAMVPSASGGTVGYFAVKLAP